MLIKTKFEGYARDGVRLYPMDGGGSSAPAPSSSTVTQTSIPDYAKPYVEKMLGQTEALAGTPYQTYDRERIAGFNPMQEQAFQGAAGMQPSQLGGFGGQLAGAATLGALGTQYDPTQFRGGQFGQREAQQYMSPYMQSVVDIQQREAERQGGIAGTQRAAQATQSGAFGGGRQAIMEAEAARNLATQKGDIQAQGLQSSYQQAQAQFNADQARRMQAQQLQEQSKQYGAGLGLQGLQTALSGAGQMGALGQQQFGQGMDINKLQAGYGSQQQQQEQNIMGQQYQDFLNQQNYPYKQLGFMSDMLRGLPLSQASQQMYQQAPGLVSQAGSLGLGAYGVSQLMGKAEGGSISEYAEGGVTGDANVSNILKGLTNDQLEQAMRQAQQNRDQNRIQMIAAELQRRAQAQPMEQEGIAGAASDSMMDRMLPTEEGMARGGIVAFADGGPSSETSLQELSGLGFTPLTPEQEREATLKQQGFLKEQYGASAMDPYLAEIKAERAGAGEEGGRMARGLGALAAASALGKRGQGTGEAISQALGAFGGTYGQIAKENKAADRALRASEMTLAQASQARDEGMFKEARGLTATAEAQRAAGLAAKRDIAGKTATIRAAAEKTGAEQAGALERTQLTTEATKRGQDITAGTAERPALAERQLQKLDDILMGKSTFAGKSGEEGATLYKASISDLGAAAYGVKHTGPAPKPVKYSPADETRAKMLGLQMSNLEGKTDKVSVEKRKVLETAMGELEQKYATPAATARPAPGAGASNIRAQVEKSGQTYDPDKYDYRVAADGSIQRKAK